MSDLVPFSMSHPYAVADTERLAALDSYDILDTPPEQGFDDIVRLATLACDTPVALVSFVAHDRQWFKARIGFPPCQTDLDSSVCAHALEEADLLVIPDLATDTRTRANPLVTGDPHIRFYAGAPLRDEQGHVLGSLCVIDKVARPAGLTAEQAETLRALARQVMTLMALRRAVSGRDAFIARRRQAVQRLGEAHARLQISEAHWRGLFERLNEGFVVGEMIRDDARRIVDWRYLDVNPAWSELVGIDPAHAIGRTVRELQPDIEHSAIAALGQVVDTGEPAVFASKVGSHQRWYEGRAFPLADDRFAILFMEVTERVQAEVRRNALLEIGDQLRDLSTVEDMTYLTASIVGRALGVTRAGFGRLDPDHEYVVVERDWTAEGMPSIAGRHRLADFGDIRQELSLGEPLIVRDALTDPRTANDNDRWATSQIRSLVNIPIQEHGRTVALFLVHDVKPRKWRPEVVIFLHNVADRLTSAVARLIAEQEQELLNQELSHRMKNMLAMIQAIASQTLKGVTEQDAVAGFRQRLHALSSAHDVLLQKSWAAAPMGEVVRAVLEQSTRIEQLNIAGPNVMLGPRATLSLSLLLHELATNAAKYGALTVEDGRIFVTWRIDAQTDALIFTWEERNGPLVEEPTRRGFGSRLLRSGLIGTGGVTLRYPPGGFTAEMRASLEQVQAT